MKEIRSILTLACFYSVLIVRRTGFWNISGSLVLVLRDLKK